MSARYETEDEGLPLGLGGQKRSTPIDADSIDAVPRIPQSVLDTGDSGPRQSGRLTEPLGGVTRPFRRPAPTHSRVTEEMEPTRTHGVPEPLPPSPVLDRSGATWFKPSVRTDPIPDLGAMAADTGNRTFNRSFDHDPGEVVAEPSPPEKRPLLDLQARPWLFSVLLGATCLAVGMVLGALLFGGKPGGSEVTPIIKCSDPPPKQGPAR